MCLLLTTRPSQSDLTPALLFKLTGGKRFKLRYAGQRARREADGSLSVVLELQGKVINAELVSAGQALATDQRYAALEASAQQAKRGLFAR